MLASRMDLLRWREIWPSISGSSVVPGTTTSSVPTVLSAAASRADTLFPGDVENSPIVLWKQNLMLLLRVMIPLETPATKVFRECLHKRMSPHCLTVSLLSKPTAPEPGPWDRNHHPKRHKLRDPCLAAMSDATCTSPSGYLMFLLSLDQASADGTEEHERRRKPPPPCAQVLPPGPRTYRSSCYPELGVLFQYCSWRLCFEFGV